MLRVIFSANRCGIFPFRAFLVVKPQTEISHNTEEPMSPNKLNQNVSLMWFLLPVLLMVPGLSGAGFDKKSSPPPPQPQKAQPQKPAPTPNRPPASMNRPPNNVNRPPNNVNRPPNNVNRPSDNVNRPSDNVKRPPINVPGPVQYRPRSGERSKDVGYGQKEFSSSNGQKVTTNARGEIRRIEVSRGFAGINKMMISRGPRGERVVETGRPGARVVSYGPRRGFVERPLRPGYISRTYVTGGHSYAHVYREYHFHNVTYYRYVPRVYYNPRFYAWAVRPWGVPVHYVWFGMATPAPWFQFFAGYFTPYQVYGSPDLWLTDYLLAENLRLAYENEQAGFEGQNPPPPPEPQPTSAALTPEVKALIAQEVRQQLEAEAAAAAQPASTSVPGAIPGSDSVPPALNQKFFVVSANLDVIATNQPCTLTPGDIIERRSTEVAPDGTVAVEVINSKPGDCAADSTTAIDLAQLQEMHNQFQEQVDSGTSLLAGNQARGLPNGPQAGSREAAEGVAAPDMGAESQVRTQVDDAVRLEGQLQQGGN